MDKREMIERVFGRLYREVNREHYCETLHDFYEYFRDALAEQAIVIECEVEQIPYDGEGDKQFWETAILPQDMDADGYIQYPDKRGSPGKAIAIIIPLEEGKVAKPNDAD